MKESSKRAKQMDSFIPSSILACIVYIVYYLYPTNLYAVLAAAIVVMFFSINVASFFSKRLKFIHNINYNPTAFLHKEQSMMAMDEVVLMHNYKTHLLTRVITINFPLCMQATLFGWTFFIVWLIVNFWMVTYYVKSAPVLDRFIKLLKENNIHLSYMINGKKIDIS